MACFILQTRWTIKKKVTETVKVYFISVGNALFATSLSSLRGINAVFLWHRGLYKYRSLPDNAIILHQAEMQGKISTSISQSRNRTSDRSNKQHKSFMGHVWGSIAIVIRFPVILINELGHHPCCVSGLLRDCTSILYSEVIQTSF